MAQVAGCCLLPCEFVLTKLIFVSLRGDRYQFINAVLLIGVCCISQLWRQDGTGQVLYSQRNWIAIMLITDWLQYSYSVDTL